MKRLPIPIRPVVATIAWLGLMCAAASGVFAAEPSQTALEDTLLADAADGRLDRFTLFEAALIAGGACDRESLEPYQRRLDNLATDYETRHPSSSFSSSGDSKRRDEGARALLVFLHERVFSHYDASSSDVRQTLDEGVYNCVSATVLYQVLGRRFDLPIVPIASPAHVRCRLLDGEPLDVETTCADWFAVVERYPDPADRAALVSRASGQPAYPQRVLTDVQLIGKIYYNRGVALIERQQYHRAMTASRLGWRLDPNDATALDNLLSSMNNAALQSADAGRFDEAAALLAECSRLAPDYAPAATNDLHVHQRWVAHLCRKQRFAEAIDLLDAGRRRRPATALFADGRHAVYRAWIDYLVDRGDADQMRIVVEAATNCRIQDVSVPESVSDI